MTLPGFRADQSDPETQKLKREYNIIKRYKQGDYLEVHFETICKS